MTFNIALVQFKPIRNNVQGNIKKIQQLLDGVTADLIILPELANTGYLYESRPHLIPFAEPNDGSGAFLGGLIDLAEATKGMIIFGYAELAGENLFNSAAAISMDGVIGNYRKIHLYDSEKLLYQPGDDKFRVLTWRGVGIGMLICFDWFFPESMRSLALAGAQIIAHPANLVLPFCQSAMITRSIENKVFTITANRIGQEHVLNKKLTFTGASQMTAPSGEVLYRGPKSKETVHVTSIDPEQALNKKISERNDLFKDRRPEFYTE
jgi:predicted amidohydrolase